MTKVALKGPVNGTGTYTLRAPETANTLELELPTAGTHLAGAQSDGMPLGPGGDPVVESGSNSDGWWTRWADGTQLCRVRRGSSSLSFGSGSVVTNVISTWVYPRAFVGNPELSCMHTTGWVYDFVGGAETVTSTHADNFHYKNHGAAHTTILTLSLITTLEIRGDE